MRAPLARLAHRVCAATALAVTGAILTSLTLSGPADAEDVSGQFDYYVLALSWSPSFCQEKGDTADPLQCDAVRPHRFIVHGLWPQYDEGWPDYCRARFGAPNRSEVDGILDIMPSRSLALHQWNKHGTCSGLSPGAYFDLTRAAFERVTIPDAFRQTVKTSRNSPESVEKAFRLANPGLSNKAMAVTCSNGTFREVRICLDRDLGFRDCPSVDSRACRASRVTVPYPG
ncbi:ribonuclease T2 [Roseibium sp. RKSG952]|uniref:ribonuclease T2 family protein n=1 Tax=Roseibium sp. RKSG952 TaxID=2529384 RepID=UPI0012BD3368|nr:ribonuclease T2 [Roseibium sp. RKSG952]MTH98135.1 ribonuclease T [Roseibium sp. RKSG952]